MMRRTLAVCALAVCVGISGCRKKQPPPAPTTLPVPAPRKAAKPPVLEPPSPDLSKPAPVPEEKKPPLPVATQPEPQAPPPVPETKPAPRRARPAGKPKPVATPPSEVPAAQPPAEPQVEAPKLGEVLTPEQRQQTAQAFEASRTEALQALTLLDKRKLNKEQAETAARARSFLAQAERLQETDLRTAAQLARRALLLTQDLLKDSQ
jgi:hypothetical protein